MMPLLLLHGAIGAAAQFTDLVKELESEYEVFTLNFSGHGGEPMPEDDFTIPLFAGNVLKFMEDRQLEKVNILGYSMGGYVALYLARHNPEKVDRIMAIATKFAWSPEIAAHETRMLNPEKIAEKVPKFASLLEERHKPADWKEVLQKTAALMTGLGNEPALSDEDMQTLSHHIRLAVGDRDNMVGLSETIKAYQQIPNGSLLVLPQTQHPFEMLDQERLVYEIRNFFK